MQAVWGSGTVSMVLCAIIFAVSALFVKLMDQAVPVFEIVSVRSLASAAMTAATIAHMRGSASDRGDGSGGAPHPRYFGKRENAWLLLSRGVTGATAMTLYYFSIMLLPLPDAVVIFFTNVVFTALLSVLGRYERASWPMFAGCSVCVVGVALLTHPTMLFGGAARADSGAHRLLGVGLGTLAAICAAGAFLSIKALGQNEEPVVMSMWFHAVAGLASVVPLLLGLPRRTMLPNAQQAALLLGVIVTSFFGQLLISRGFQLLSPSLAAAINLTQVLHAHVLSMLVLHAPVHWYSFVGALLIVAGVLLTQRGRHGRAIPTGEGSAGQCAPLESLSGDAEAPGTPGETGKLLVSALSNASLVESESASIEAQMST